MIDCYRHFIRDALRPQERLEFLYNAFLFHGMNTESAIAPGKDNLYLDFVDRKAIAFHTVQFFQDDLFLGNDYITVALL